MWSMWLPRVAALLPLLAPRLVPPRMSGSAGTYPDFDYENAAASQALQSNPEPAAIPRSLESAMTAFDFAGSSDEEVAAMATLLFDQLQREATELASTPLTEALARRDVLQHDSLGSVLASVLAGKICRSDQLGGATEPPTQALAMRAVMAEAYASPAVQRGVVADLIKCYRVDPACEGLLQPVLFFKGYQALQVYRVANALWRRDSAADRGAALLLQSRASEVFSVDIHPAATIGNGVMLDHATAIVIGSTCILGDDIYMLHQVTLGATGKPAFGAKRHPTVGSGVVLGAGCTVLGDVAVGDGAVVGASAIVTMEIPEGATVVGVNKIVQKKDPGADEYTWLYEI